MKERGRVPERVRLTRGARWLLMVAFAVAGMLGFLLVRTFRSPNLEAADARMQDEAADTGRDPVPPQATMPGAPDSGWAPATGADASQPLPPPVTAAQRTYTPSVARPPAVSRRYTDADLRAIAAARGAAAAHDRGYIVALRQRRVDELSRRLDSAHSAEERATLGGWLEDARRDLERAQRE